jgi:hypothetical protein
MVRPLVVSAALDNVAQLCKLLAIALDFALPPTTHEPGQFHPAAPNYALHLHRLNTTISALCRSQGVAISHVERTLPNLLSLVEAPSLGWPQVPLSRQEEFKRLAPRARVLHGARLRSSSEPVIAAIVNTSDINEDWFVVTSPPSHAPAPAPLPRSAAAAHTSPYTHLQRAPSMPVVTVAHRALRRGFTRTPSLPALPSEHGTLTPPPPPPRRRAPPS